MEKDVLSEVIEVEKEIQKCLELEKVRSREWLEQARKEFEEGYAREEQTIAASLRQSIAEAQKNAGIRASDIETQARRTTGLLAGMSSEVLSRIAEKHIASILPG